MQPSYVKNTLPKASCSYLSTTGLQTFHSMKIRKYRIAGKQPPSLISSRCCITKVRIIKVCMGKQWICLKDRRWTVCWIKSLISLRMCDVPCHYTGPIWSVPAIYRCSGCSVTIIGKSSTILTYRLRFRCSTLINMWCPDEYMRVRAWLFILVSWVSIAYRIVSFVC